MSETSCFSSSLRQCSSETLRSISGKVAEENDCDMEFFCFNADLKFEQEVYGVLGNRPCAIWYTWTMLSLNYCSKSSLTQGWRLVRNLQPATTRRLHVKHHAFMFSFCLASSCRQASMQPLQSVWLGLVELVKLEVLSSIFLTSFTHPTPVTTRQLIWGYTSLSSC